MKKVIALTMVLVVGAMLAPAYGAMSTWNFNEGTGDYAYDGSGNGNTLTRYPAAIGGTGPLWTADGGGRTGLAGDYALTYDGVDDRAGRGDSDTLDASNYLKLDAWINPSTPSGNDSGEVVMVKFDAYSLKLHRSGDNPVATISFNLYIEGTGWYTFYAGGVTNLEDNQWNHIEAIYDASLGTDTMRVFVDDIRIDAADTHDQTGTINNSTHDLVLGRWNDSAGRYKGLIDDVAISIPEPATMVLLGLGGVGLLVRRKRKV